MEEIEIPQYFLCPISLEIMRDPVTTNTGISYDRESIENWLRTSRDNPTCPVTKQPLPKGSDSITPNHTLHRLIQSWMDTRASPIGRNRPIRTREAPLDNVFIKKIIGDLEVPWLALESLTEVELLTGESKMNRVAMVEAGMAKAIANFVVRCWQKRRVGNGLEEALNIFHFMWDLDEAGPLIMRELNGLIRFNMEFIDSLTWVLELGNDFASVKAKAIACLSKAIKVVSPTLTEKLTLGFFKAVLKLLKQKVSSQALKSALLVLIEACRWGQNRAKVIQAKAVFDLIELELDKPAERNITELIVELLSQLCLVAEGRQQLLKHAGSVAMLTKRVLRVSPATDDRAVNIFGLISRFSASDEVLLEMLRVGAVSKLCMVMQADCDMHLKEKARGILRLHSHVWNNSPCIAVYLLTRQQGPSDTSKQIVWNILVNRNRRIFREL